jgi:rhodanese-related sulfurtransferase
MPRTVDLHGLRELLDRGAQLVEVLPRDEYDEMHLPGAVHLPLKELDAEHAGAVLDRSRAVVVYCWDALCDMSPRAAERLATLGYDTYDYALSKVDWMAHGLPIEGTAADHPTARTLMRDDVATFSFDEPPEEVARRIDATPYGFALALSPDRVVLGRVRRSRLTDAGVNIEPVLEPGPSTIRPHTTIEELGERVARSEIHTFIVTDPEGKLLGVVRSDDVEVAHR